MTRLIFWSIVLAVLLAITIRSFFATDQIVYSSVNEPEPST
jgi:hypothetical protein